MTLPGLVLIHGGGHAADCWDPTIGELRRAAPQLQVLTVDLPGRRGKPGDLRTATIRDWVDSVVDDIDTAGLRDVVVVGHSAAGLIVPGVVTKLGAARAREAVFVSAFVPPQGSALVDTLPRLAAPFIRWAARFARNYRAPGAAGLLFCNGMNPAQRQFATSRVYPESLTITAERVDRSNMPDCVPRTWIMTLRDRAVSKDRQQRGIEALGGVGVVYSIDACHDVMISQPQRLAQILLERCETRTNV